MSLDSADDTITGIENLIARKIEGIHTCLPAQIIAFDAATCLASVMPKVTFFASDGREMEYPVITGVPVFMPHAGSAQITYPVKAGDACLVVFAERSIDEWIGKGSNDNHDPRQYDLTDGFCFVGMMPAQNISAENVELINNGTKISLTPDNSINIIGNVNIKGNVNIDGNYSCLGESHMQGSITCDGDVTANNTSLLGHTHGCPHGGNTGAPN